MTIHSLTGALRMVRRTMTPSCPEYTIQNTSRLLGKPLTKTEVGPGDSLGEHVTHGVSRAANNMQRNRLRKKVQARIS
jgi:hypothetical protein